MRHRAGIGISEKFRCSCGFGVGRDRRNFSRRMVGSLPPASVGGDAEKFLYNELLPNASDKNSSPA